MRRKGKTIVSLEDYLELKFSEIQLKKSRNKPSLPAAARQKPRLVCLLTLGSNFSTSTFRIGCSTFGVSLSFVFRLPAAGRYLVIPTSLISPSQLYSPIPITCRSRLVESPRKGIQVVAQGIGGIQQVVYPSKNLQFPIP